MSAWYVYIIEASNDSLYTGITRDVERRFAEHAAGRGAKYFNASRRPLRVVYTEAVADRSTAQVREAAIKGLSRQEKLLLVEGRIEGELAIDALTKSEIKNVCGAGN